MAKISLGDSAYSYILEKILNCTYAPGSTLNEESLVAELGISRTPIRAALQRLQHEQLVQIMPKRGVRVTAISPDNVRDIFELRILLESYIIRNYGRNSSKDQLLQFLSFFQANEKPLPDQLIKSNQMDDKFHLYIVSLACNQVIDNLFAGLKNQTFRIAVWSGRVVSDRITNSNKEHCEILNAMLEDNFDLAADLMVQHLNLARYSTYQAFLHQDAAGIENA